MNDTNQKIGHLIYQIRQERGLTQASFAKKLGTSQSAVNRIERGKQNLSLETLGRISDVLNKQIISLSGGAVNLRIEGGRELTGEIELKTSKNAAVAILCASLLNKGTTKLKRVARIEEVNRIIEVLTSIGVQVRWLPDNDLEIKPPAKLQLQKMNKEAARKTRIVIMLAGALMHDHKEFQIPYAGGCELGRRTIIPHIYGLGEFGTHIEAHSGHYEVNVNRKQPVEPVVMYEISDIATENVLLAAARFEGETIIKDASANYMVQDLCFYLQKLGVKIDGIGSSTLRVRGVKEIKKNVTYALSEDPVEAMTFKGDNGQIDLTDITIYKHNGKLNAPEEKLHPLPGGAGINIDNLPYFLPIVAVAQGRTLIHDWVFEDRALMFTELKKIGVNMELADPHRVFVNGPTKWRSADIVAPSGLRPAVILLIGMLAAPGISMLRNVYTINRGYEDLATRLNSLGANIAVLHEI
jgi:UDP-N-acetylglucosamine 1-carboxyvinyltransferase